MTSGIYNFAVVVVVVIMILMFYAFLSAAAVVAPEGYIAHRFSFAAFFGDPNQTTYGMLLFNTRTQTHTTVCASINGGGMCI